MTLRKGLAGVACLAVFAGLYFALCLAFGMPTPEILP